MFLKALVFTIAILAMSPAFAGAKGSLVISGELPPEMIVESIVATYDSGYCSTKQVKKSGKVSTKKGKFAAKIEFKGELGGLFPACYRSLRDIELTFSYTRNELGSLAKYSYKKYFTPTGSSATLSQKGILNCGTIDGSPQDVYERCSSSYLPERIGFADNQVTGVKVNLVKPAPPIVDENAVLLRRDIPEWKMSFTIYQNAQGKIGPGSILQVKSKNSAFPTGYYRIRELEMYSDQADPAMWGQFLVNGQERFFRFSPLGLYNSVYTDCKSDASAELIITDTFYNSKSKKTFCGPL